MKKLIVILFILTVMILFPNSERLKSASLYLSPPQGNFSVGDTFDLSIFVDTESEDINAIDIGLGFDPQKIQITEPSNRKSFIEVWVAQPVYSNLAGTMRFIGGVPSPGINTSEGLISTVTFRVINPGETSISFLESSKVLRNDSQGTNILSSSKPGFYNFTFPAPESPKISSPTHPNQNKWYKDNNPTFSWEKEEGVNGFSYSFDQDPLGTPDNVFEGDHTSVSYSEIKDGVWYFHIKAQKEEVWGGTSSYVVWIDTAAPASFSLEAEPSFKTTEKDISLSFKSTDALSGVDYYQVRYFNVEEKTQKGLFTEAKSPYKLSFLDVGRYSVEVRAYDSAGNWREETEEIEILGTGTQTTQPFPWKIIILILSVIFILLLISFFFQKRKRDLVRKEREELKKAEKKSESPKEEIEDSQEEVEKQRETESSLSGINNFDSISKEKNNYSF
jgi:hypothetical protein